MATSQPIPTDRRFINHTGQTFTRLTVLSYAGRTEGGTVWNCRCVCGKVTRVAGNKLRTGRTRSCGCLSREQATTRTRTHGLAHRIPEYAVWREMRSRCNNRRHKQYPDYGGRGVTVCARWQSFATFLADMGRRPTARHSIDRFPNNDGPYEPGNCRWATPSQQMRNKRTNRMLTHAGRTMCLAAWANELGITLKTLHARLSRYGLADRTFTKGLLR